MVTAENMFREAALLQLTATCWQLDKKLPQSMLADVGNVDFLRGRKLLLAPDSTALIKQHIGKARNYLRKISLPFPIKGCVLVPKKLIPEIQEHLKEIKWHYNSAVEDFLYWYPQTVKDAKDSLGELFDECDYPTQEMIKNKFRFQWRYITIGPSVSRVLPPSIYKEEVKKFQELMEQARSEAITALREEFVDLVTNIADKLQNHDDGKPRRLRDAAVENLKQFLDNFSSRNIFDDAQLSELVEQCRGIITNTNANAIRGNTQVRQELHQQMEKLLTGIDASLEDLPRRRLRFAA
ncbi:MAG TPA: DUF3150 domain-containing protein [Desulfovibrio piger]|uniref:DUF3150 domain-containing protein n=1 Tax=Desulfovibrio piger ATCC 29098 TaxID=411464 RepID=B6WXQ6_9BACT|nr:DUF3150 domain-containing protein [Desulfovibrio piger]EEB32264.1 hypothetical protein DESPIG_02883 [Desulfovibrio piger ATCC 29098]HCZ43280.1 DUF3150 domain-containing protein [Desulfovibrio piger]